MKDSKKHICHTCKKEFPTCDSKHIIFGDGVGTDNVVNCNAYKSIEEKELKNKRKGEKIVIMDGIFYDGSTKQEIESIKNSYPNKEVIIHLIRPREAHITVYDKVEVEKYILVGEYYDGKPSISKGTKEDIKGMLEIKKNDFINYIIARVIKEETLIE